MNAVFHHGGAGTTAAGLRAGLPTIIKPFFGDQMFWAGIVKKRKIGVRVDHFSVRQVKNALIEVTRNTNMILKAKEIGENIKLEDGVSNAIKQIYEDYKFAEHQIKQMR